MINVRCTAPQRKQQATPPRAFTPTIDGFEAWKLGQAVPAALLVVTLNSWGAYVQTTRSVHSVTRAIASWVRVQSTSAPAAAAEAEVFAAVFDILSAERCEF
jgi:hypothetical protein